MPDVHIPRASTLVTLLVAIAALFMSVASDAADDPAKPATTPPAADADTPAKADAAAPKGPFDLPAEDASPQELVLFMKRLGRLPPEDQTQAGIIAHFNKLDGVIEQLLQRNLDESSRTTASSFKFEVLTLLQEFGDESAPKRRADHVALLAKSEQPDIADMGRRFTFMLRIEGVPDATDEDRLKLVDDLAAYFEEVEIEGRQAGLALEATDMLEKFAPEVGVTAFNVFAKHLERSQIPELAGMATMFYGAARRLELPGNPIEIAGKTVDGQDFDIKQLKGKVVLVDFWATFCAPCLQEMPNVLENYAKYHSKGFEVVGISLDEDTRNLSAFLEVNEIPWITLIDEDETKRGFENPIVLHYGVNKMPKVILVDQEGKVVSLDARGERLDDLLAQLLGPPDEKPATEQPASETKPSAESKPAAKVPSKQPLVPTKQPLVPTKQPIGGK